MKSEPEVVKLCPKVENYLRDKAHVTINGIVGKVLTIVDAVTEDVVKRKAVGGLVRQAIWSELKTMDFFIEQLVISLAEKLGEDSKPSRPIDKSITAQNVLE